jgi:hypothetical protein
VLQTRVRRSLHARGASSFARVLTEDDGIATM